jgi:hypothetical protein
VYRCCSARYFYRSHFIVYALRPSNIEVNFYYISPVYSVLGYTIYAFFSFLFFFLCPAGYARSSISEKHPFWFNRYAALQITHLYVTWTHQKKISFVSLCTFFLGKAECPRILGVWWKQMEWGRNEIKTEGERFPEEFILAILRSCRMYELSLIRYTLRGYYGRMVPYFQE